jgi:hypothetical protein
MNLFWDPACLGELVSWIELTYYLLNLTVHFLSLSLIPTTGRYRSIPCGNQRYHLCGAAGRHRATTGATGGYRGLPGATGAYENPACRDVCGKNVFPDDNRAILLEWVFQK